MFGLLNKRRYRLQLDEAAGVELDTRETVLNGALRNGLDFPYSCKVGGCGSCKCQLVSGKVRELTDKSYLLSKDEIAQGYILGCQSIPLSDVVVRLPNDPLARQRVEGRIVAQQPLTQDIAEIRVVLDAPIQYRAGQYTRVQLLDDDTPSRCYSYARAAGEEGTREASFIVRAMPQGRMSQALLAPAAIGRRVRLNGSLGEFHLRDGERDILCVAGGSGLGPIHAMLEAAVGTAAARRRVTLLMGARRTSDLYWLDRIESLRVRWQGAFEFVPVLSEEPADSGWQGLRGWVTEPICEANAAGADGYLCGPPPMIDAAIARMNAHGLPAERIHFDKFADQSTVVPQARVA